MNSFTFVMPYYRNTVMLGVHVANWNAYPAELRDRVKVLIVDDCSPEPAEPILRECRLTTSLYRIHEDIPFNAHGARNLGATMLGKGDVWGLFTDMDILFEPHVVAAMLEKKWKPAHHYTFERTFMDGRPPKYHCNSMLVTSNAYWAAGGYDEDFCGSYGGDGIFHRALERHTARVHWTDVCCVGYNDVVADCSTRDLDRQGPMKKEYLRRRDEKKARPNGLVPCNPLRFTWSKVF